MKWVNAKARVGEPIIAFSAFFGISCPIRTPFHPLSNLDNAQQSTSSSQCDNSSAIFNINMEEQRYSSDNDLSCDTRNWERPCDKRKYTEWNSTHEAFFLCHFSSAELQTLIQSQSTSQNVARSLSRQEEMIIIRMRVYSVEHVSSSCSCLQFPSSTSSLVENWEHCNCNRESAIYRLITAPWTLSNSSRATQYANPAPCKWHTRGMYVKMQLLSPEVEVRKTLDEHQFEADRKGAYNISLISSSLSIVLTI